MQIKNEINVRELFAQQCQDYGLEIEASGTSFPDYTLRQGDELIQAEAEYKSGNFLTHGHDPTACDLVICWEHNIPLPVRTLELRTGNYYAPGQVGEIKQAARQRSEKQQDEKLDTCLISMLESISQECFAYWMEYGDIWFREVQFKKCIGGAALALSECLGGLNPDAVRHIALLWLQARNSGKLNTSRLNNEQEIKASGT